MPATTDPSEGADRGADGVDPPRHDDRGPGNLVSTSAGPPDIPAVDITPFKIDPADNKIPFPSQTATNSDTARIPQDLTSFIAAGTITQAILDDPNTVLRNHIASQNITSTTTIDISTKPAAPLFGGGTDNIAFLLGTRTPNAATTQMGDVLDRDRPVHPQVPIFEPGHPPLIIPAETGAAGSPFPSSW